MSESVYTQMRHISLDGLFSFDVYSVKPGGVDKKHHHNCFEVVYIVRGNCKTHKQGKIYVYQKDQVHELINDSKDTLVVACLTIPPESKENTVYV